MGGSLSLGPEARRTEFERLLQTVLKPLYNTALSYTHNPTDAEDLVQEVVLRAYRGFDHFELGTNFKAWVFRILTTLCINRFHREGRRPEAVGYDEVEREAEVAASQLQSPTVNPTAALFDQMLDGDVQAAIGALPVEFRTVVILSDVQDHTYQEIAGILEIPLGTVRSRLSRGRRLLRDALLDYARERGLVREDDLV